MGAKISVVGSINIDLVTQVARFPKPGETVLGGDLESIAGGKGANQAVAAARLGSQVSMIGRVGDDVFGPQLRSNLASAGIDVTHVYTSDETASGVALIVVEEAGQNNIVVAPGANSHVSPQDVDRAKRDILESQLILLQLEIPLETVLHAAQIAHGNGVKVILNPAPAQPLPAELLSLIDILVPNESETITLTSELDHDNIPSIGEKAPVELLINSLGLRTVIQTAGEQGAYLYETRGRRLFPAYTVGKVVDTTAAGDAFVGGLATAIAEGKPIKEAILWGNAAGAFTVTRVGAQPSLPSRTEVESLIASTSKEQLTGLKVV